MFYFYKNFALADDVQKNIFDNRSENNSWLCSVGGVSVGGLIECFGRPKLRSVSLLGGFCSYSLLRSRFFSESAAYENLGRYGCLFFCCLWILHKMGISLDIYDSYRKCLSAGLIDEECSVKSLVNILNFLSGLSTFRVTESVSTLQSSDKPFSIREYRLVENGVMKKHFIAHCWIKDKRDTFNSWVDSKTQSQGSIYNIRYISLGGRG